MNIIGTLCSRLKTSPGTRMLMPKEDFYGQRKQSRQEPGRMDIAALQIARKAVWLKQQAEWWESTKDSMGASLVYPGNKCLEFFLKRILM